LLNKIKNTNFTNINCPVYIYKLNNALIMGLFSVKKKIKVPPLICGKIYNYINIDSINEKKLKDFYCRKCDKRKGILAGKVEMIYLEPGDYSIIAHEPTYLTTPALIYANIKANENYILGADENGIYLNPHTSDETSFL